MSEEVKRDPVITRRTFLARFVGGAAGVVAAALASSLAVYFISPTLRKPRGRSVTVSIARVSDIPVGTPTFVTYKRNVSDGWVSEQQSTGAWVVTKDGKDFAVYDPHCTHLGCLFSWNSGSQQFHCPCHGSLFSIDGTVIGGPAPRPLDKMAFTIKNGSIDLTVTES